MSNERGPLREISWRDVCPWLILFRTFRIAISVHVLLLAALGATACTGGWMLSELLFVRQETLENDLSFKQLVISNNQWPWDLGKQDARFGHGGRNAGERFLSQFFARAAAIPQIFIDKFVEPLRNVFLMRVTLAKSAYCLFGGLWCLAVWAFFGGAITRIAVMRLGCEERVGLKEALRHACRKFGAYFAAPLMPMIAVAFLVLPLILLGLVMKADVGVLLAGLLWLFVIIDALIMGVLLIGLLFGWPLMWGTISAEGSDSFDALSRSYNYAFQRPLHYFFYLLVASLFGVFCFYLVGLFSNIVTNLALWGVSWGAGNERMGVLLGVVENESGAADFGVEMISFFTNFVYLIVGAFAYAFFWSVAAAVYLLLRYDVDQTEFDEIWLEENEQKYELPQLKPNESGVPQLASTAEDENVDAQLQPPDHERTSDEDQANSDEDTSPTAVQDVAARDAEKASNEPDDASDAADSGDEQTRPPT